MLNTDASEDFFTKAVNELRAMPDEKFKAELEKHKSTDIHKSLVELSDFARSTFGEAA